MVVTTKKTNRECNDVNDSLLSSQEIMREMQQHLSVLKQLKDFDKSLSREIAAKAYQEQEKIKLEVLMTQF